MQGSENDRVVTIGNFRKIIYHKIDSSQKHPIMSGGYANEKPPSSTGSGEGDLTADPASSGFFNTDFKRLVSIVVLMFASHVIVKL